MKKISAILAVMALLSLVLLPQLVLAQTGTPDTSTYIPPEFTNTVGNTLPTTSVDVPTVIAKIINLVLGFLGIVAVVIIIIGGFIWMTAAGNEEKVGTAKKLLYSGLIGLVIILSAYAIANFVIGKITSDVLTQ